MQEKLTDRAFWVNYWANFQYPKVPYRMLYEKQLKDYKGLKSFIEIGGFPGVNVLYFYRNICNDVSLLDFFIDENIIHRFERFNNVAENTIQCIEADFFSYTPTRKYDIVFSSGFIEHFSDSRDVIKRHVDMLSERGRLMIILPNFRGLNGAVQWLFDRENLRAHNLKSMDIRLLTQITEELGLKDIIVEYTRKPMIWLEPKPAFLNRIFRLPIKGLSLFLKLFPIKSRFLSPYIILTARMQEPDPLI